MHGRIRSVLGDISPKEFGPALVHEHILVSHAPAHDSENIKYDRDEVFEVMLPFLIEIRRLGVKGLAECSTAYMGRDVIVLRRLSEASGIHILTNTGFFLEPYIPKHVFRNSIDEIAEKWIYEIEKGIDGTEVRAGFIKIALEPGRIEGVYEKIIRAAARCSISTGAVIACHMESGKAAMLVSDIIKEEGAESNRLIFVHADSEENLDYHLEAVKRGLWIEYDRISQQTSERSLRLVRFISEKGFEDQLLLSQDSGWYSIGQPRGGNIRGYSYLVKNFIPLMKKQGFNNDLIDKIMVDNPCRAFQIE